MKRIVIFFVAMAFLGVLSFAQENTGEILGKVVLADGAPLPGVSVTLTGTTYGKNVIVTSTEGNYRYPKLSPGNFQLRFELEGFKTVIRKDFRLSVGQNLAMNVVMEPGTIQEEITVIGTAPMINTRKANVSLNMSAATVDMLPTSRTTTEVIAMAPGIMSPDPTYGGQGSGVIHGFGSRNMSAEFNVDGASFISTYGTGGMPAGVNMARVEETQVTTSNQDITNVQGGVSVNFVSKRAGNKVSGDFYIDMLDHSMQSTKALPQYMRDPVVPVAPNTVAGLGYKTNSGIYRIYRYGATLGFPVWKDHLWFYGAWGVTDTIQKSLAGTNADRYYAPDFYGKVNAQWGKTSAEFSFNKSDNTAKNVDFSASIMTMNKLDKASPTNTYTGQISTTLFDKLLLSAKATYFHKTVASLQANNTWTGAGDTTYEAGRTYNPPNRYYTYNFFKGIPYNTEPTGYWQEYGYQEKRPYIIAEANYFAEKLLGGDHEIKIGFDLNYGRYIEEYMAPNQMFVHAYPWSSYSSVSGNAPMLAGTGNAYWSRFQTYCDRFGEYRAERQGLFLQDILTYGRLTINLGVRFDHHNWVWEAAPYHGLAPADHPITAWDNWTGPITVAGGKQDMGYTFSPRISAAYDVFGTGKDVIKLSYANYGGALQAGITGVGQLGLQTMGGLKSGYTRGEFYLPYNDLNKDFVPSWEELNLPFDPKKLQYGFPTPTELLNMIAVGNAEQAAWKAQFGALDIPWTYWTYPGWNLMNFVGPILGKATPGGLPTILLKDKTGTYKGYTPPRILELTLGYEKQLTNDLKVGAMAAYKKEYNFPRAVGFWGNINSYTLIPVETTYLAGKDPVTGWEIWNAKPVNPATWPAQSGTIYTNYKKYYNYFKGLEIIVNKKLSNKWMANASLDLMSWKQHKDQSEFPGTTLWDYYQDTYVGIGQYFSTEPQQNARWHLKVNGLYQLPMNITISAILDARDGYLVPQYQSTYLSNLLPPAGSKFGDLRMPTMWYLNLALDKTWILSEGSQVTVHLTGYNITDNNITTRVNTAATKLPTDIKWMTAIQPSRIFEVGIRYSFR